MTEPIQFDSQMPVVSDQFVELGYGPEASLLIEPGRGRYVATFYSDHGNGMERSVAWEPAEPDRQKLGVQWARNNPIEAVLDLMRQEKERRAEEGLEP